MKLENFLDNEGKIKVWPAKKAAKVMMVEYLATKFEYDVEYTEREVNDIIKQWHTFNDYFLLRRSLIDWKSLTRTRDGAIYWRTAE